MKGVVLFFTAIFGAIATVKFLFLNTIDLPAIAMFFWGIKIFNRTTG
jgi:hypothetical protein